MEPRCAVPIVAGRGGITPWPPRVRTTRTKKNGRIINALVGGGGGGGDVGGGTRGVVARDRRVRHDSRLRRLPHRGVSTTRAMALPPNKEWPPADVWEDFRKAVSGEWEGHAVTCDPRGDVLPLPSNYVPDAFREYGVGVNQWATRSTTHGDEPGDINDVDSFATQTRYLYPEAGCDFGREDVAKTREEPQLLAGGQLGKMCIVDGDYCDGPLLLPPCELGARARFEFGFCTRVTQDDEDDEAVNVSKGPIKLNLENKNDDEKKKQKQQGKKTNTYKVPPRRFRVGVVIEAVPDAKRNWRAAEIEIISESRVVALGGGGGGGGGGTAIEPAPEPEKGVKLGEDDIATGNWRAVSGVTFLTCESLLSEEDFNELFKEKEEEKKQTGEEEEEGEGAAAAAAVAGKNGNKKVVGRGRVKRGDGGKKMKKKNKKSIEETETAAAVETVNESTAATTGAGAEAEAETTTTAAAAAAALTVTTTDAAPNPKPPPEGLVVVPSWAVQAKAPFSSAHEYLVGGNSPLALLPLRAWCLVESIGDEVLIEVGVYAGVGGLNETDPEKKKINGGGDGDGGGGDDSLFDMNATEGGTSEPRRVIARRYERGGRFASAFFVEESRMTEAELEVEKEDGEGGKPMYF